MSDPTYRDMGLKDEEYEKILKIMGREPNLVETGIWAVMWSEHCGYKSSRPLLKGFPTSGDRVIQGPGENAGVVDIGDNQALVFKVESHNHPSALEPFQGAATGVGGIVRDIFTMGARPIANLNSLRFGTIDNAHVRQLFSGVVEGIASYGNCLGIPTIGGEVGFHPTYQENPLVNAMCVGLVNHDEIAYAVANEVGAPVMIVGARTGRDGIHGATFASEELSQKSSEKRSSVQVGDPFMEKLLIEACLELIQEDLVSGMQDLGAAGLTSSIVETASKKGRGVEVDVLKVPRREQGMTPYEVMLSESQERMLIVPRAGAEARITEIFEKWGLSSVVIGRITDDGIFRIKEGEKVVGEVPVKELTDGCPTYRWPSEEPAYYEEKKRYDLTQLPPADVKKAIMQLLASPNIASKRWVYDQYDYQVMTNTVVVPGQADAAVLRIRGKEKGVAFAIDCSGRMVYLDPYKGGMMAVCEAARNVACVGAEPLALTNCLNFGNPEKPNVYWQMEQAISGMAEAARILETPVVSGNVSLYNETVNGAIYPTPVVGMTGLLPHVDKRCTMDYKQAGDKIFLLGRKREELGGSEYLAIVHGIEAGAVPDVNLKEEKALLTCLVTAIDTELLTSCHDISEGGLLTTVMESAIAGKIGCELKLEDGNPAGVLFSEAASRVVVTVVPEKAGALRHLAEEFGLEVHEIGTVGGKNVIVKAGQITTIPLAEAAAVWSNTISEWMAK